MSSTTRPSSPPSVFIWAGALVALTLAAYWPVVTFEFLNWDDSLHITSNWLMHPPALERSGYYWTHGFLGLYIPVTYTLWTFIGGLSMSPAMFHAANLAVHLACVLIVFAIVRRLVGSDWPAALGAAIFAVHPMQAETVAWISAFRDGLAGVFMFAAIWAFLRRAHMILWICFVLAILSKPTAAVLPAMLLILGWAQQRPLKSLCATIGPMFLISIACVAWTRHVQPSTLLEPAPLWARPLVALDALAFYAKKLLWPAPLGFDYGRTPAAILQSGQALFTWLLPVAGAAAVAAVARRQRLFAAAAMLFVAGVAPVLGLVPFDFQDKSTVADHYVYASMLGSAIGVAVVAARWDSRIVRAAGAAIVLTLAVLSWVQIGSWRDTRSLAENGLRVNPRSFSALNLLTWEALDEQNPRLAERFARESLSARAENIDALINLGAAMAMQDRAAEALPPLQRAVELRPDLADAHANLAAAYGELGRVADALRHCQIALEINPNHSQATVMLPLLRQGSQRAPATTQWSP